jgi:hypothetical protein
VNLRVTIDDGTAAPTVVTGAVTLDRDRRVEVPVP